MSIQILKPEELKRGGGIVIAPFRAGSDAEAGPGLDHFSFLIVKGAADRLADLSSVLKYFSGDAPDRADFMVHGHIEQFSPPAGIRRLMFRKPVSVRIKADLVDLKTREVLAVIYVNRTGSFDPKSVDKMGYDIGYDLADGLLK